MNRSKLAPSRPERFAILLTCLASLLATCSTFAQVMRDRIDLYGTDLGSIERRYDVRLSDQRVQRMQKFYGEQLEGLKKVDFEKLDQAGKIDYVLLRTKIEFELRELAHEQKETSEAASFMPFAQTIVDLENARRSTTEVDGAQLAKTLTDLRAKVVEARKAAEQTLRQGRDVKETVPIHVVSRALRSVESLRNTLRRWHGYYAGYDPEFTWWVRQPYTDVDQALEEYTTFLRRRAGLGSDSTPAPTGTGRGGFGRGGGGSGRSGTAPASTESSGSRSDSDDNDPIIGNPIGRQALLDALEAEMIPYTPEELIEIANREFAWCEAEMKKAMAELKVEKWQDALDLVSKKHVKPGDQPKLIKELAEEAIKFLEDRDLVTIPPLAKETWRIEMMSAERQRVNPYFTGGEVISVSYPTDAMSHEDKLMSMRGNNPAFSRATVQHELIPGHHLQIFMADRYNVHRKLFRTPFLVEGWALYWEMLLWDKQFPRNAEDRVGMLFWRSHRCARIIFSLNFHLGKMTAQECIDLLVDRVGHERRNATAEVRRSVQGGYPPLYQAAYMLGGLQIRQMHKDLVGSGKMTDKQFHDAILKENSIPIAMIRASLTKQPLTRDFKSDWRFYPGLDSADKQAAKATTENLVAPQANAARVNAETDRPRVYRDRIEPHWFASNTRFWYRTEGPGGTRQFVVVDAAKGKREPAFDHARVAALITKESGKEVAADKLPVDSLEFSEKGDTVKLASRQQSYVLTLATYALAKDTAKPQAEASLPSDQNPRPSRRTGPATQLTFSNETDKEVKLFWSDTNGERQQYGTLKPEERREISTYAGHVWIVTAMEGELLAVFEATENSATAALRPQTATSRIANAANRAGAALRGRGGQGQGAGRSARSPDGKFEAFVKDHNLYLREREGGQEVQLSTDGDASNTYSRDRYRAEAMQLARPTGPAIPASAPDVYWSPDSKRLIAMRTRVVTPRTVYMVESSPRDQVQPKLQSMQYAKPGDELPIQKPRLFDVESKKQVEVSDELFADPYDLNRMRWDANSTRFLFTFNERGHQALRVLSIDAATGAVKALINEQSKTFIDYSGKQFLEYLENEGEMIWMSERDGWNHLYLYDAKTGDVKNQITKGEWVVRGVDQVDREKRQIWFRTGAIRPGQDPYYVHYARINFDGTGLTILTEGDGTHTIDFSPDRQYFIDTWSRVDRAPVTELRRSEDGSLATRLEDGDASEFASNGRAHPEPFVAKGRDGKTDIYGVIWRPRNFDPTKKYPVIENIYAGPHSAFVPKNFRTTYAQQRLADRGYVVVQIDGMGTSLRSKAFHDVAWKNIADAGFPDRTAWHKAAAAKYPYMDLTRVGIYGGSAGGQNAMGALLFHPEFYKAGVADCGCHDNRMDKIWWNEQWMGRMGDHYAASSNVVNAHKLQGKLLLFVGELDRNVDPASTMQVVNALIKADKDFDLVVFPGAGHGAGGSPYGQRRMYDFFARHLQGVTPTTATPSLSSTN